MGNTPMAMGFSLGGPGDHPRRAPGHRKNAFLPQAGLLWSMPEVCNGRTGQARLQVGIYRARRSCGGEHPRETFTGSAAGRELCLRPGSRAMSAPHRRVLAAKAIC